MLVTMRTSLLLALGLAASCAYPRFHTALSAAEAGPSVATPNGVVRIRFQGAEIPPTDGDRQWDDDGTGPDSYVRIYRDDELLFESEPAPNAIRPNFDFTTPNLYLPTSSRVRIELWDDDGVRQPASISAWTGRGLPPMALRDADAHLTMDRHALLNFRVIAPTVERGVGILEFEARSDRLVVLEVVRFSPAGRAGLRAGDEIVSIGERAIADMSTAEAQSALSMASSRRASVRYERNGSSEEASIDGGYVWQTR